MLPDMSCGDAVVSLVYIKRAPMSQVDICSRSVYKVCSRPPHGDIYILYVKNGNCFFIHQIADCDSYGIVYIYAGQYVCR